MNWTKSSQHMLTLIVMSLARLGLKALVLAWLEVALAVTDDRNRAC
jgi:hypothetical protein